MVAYALLLIILMNIPGCSSNNKVQASPEDVVKSDNTLDENLEDIEKALGTEVKIDLPYNAAIYQSLVKPYKVSDNLSNIENIHQFKGFTAEEIEMLSKNSFFVSPSSYNQLYYIYEKNVQSSIPSFITLDSVLQMYQVLYNKWQRKANEYKVIKILEDLTGSMLNKSIYLYYSTENKDLIPYIVKNIAYFAVSQLVLKRSLPSDIPTEAKDLAEKEYMLIQNGAGFRKSEIFPYKIDYRKFHLYGYNNSSTYIRYFKAIQWYSEAYFPLYLDDIMVVRDEEHTLQALLITYCMFMDNDDVDALKWKKLYEINELYNGISRILTVYELKDLMYKAYGDNPNVEELNEAEKLDNFYKNAVLKITSSVSDEGLQFRFMSNIHMPDSNIMPQLVDHSKRPVPRGTDVMGVLGFDRAFEISIQDNSWKEYPKIFETLKSDYMKLPDSTWRSGMYYGWLWCLKSLNRSYNSGYPAFMANTAWQDKSLNTALAAWALMKSDYMQYDLQLITDTAYDEKPAALGYVEPCIEAYSRVLWLTRYLRENLEKRELLPDDVKKSMDSFETLVEFLINCSVKELKNEELTEEEYKYISNFGKNMERIIAGSVLSDKDSINEKQNEKSMATIADLYTNSYSGSILQAGVGSAFEIYVVVPIAGKLYLTKGAVFSYYEFTNHSGQSLTVGKWQTMLEDGNLWDGLPWWTESYIIDGNLSAATP